MTTKLEEINHKGTWCPYKDIFCQEGRCSNCQIYRDTIGRLTETRRNGIREVAREEMVDTALLVLDFNGVMIEITAQYDKSGLRLSWERVYSE